MTSSEQHIGHVSDTAIWVAYYRAKETERADALFRDPLAKILVGERGKKIADDMNTVGRYTEWAVISRTVIIDDFIRSLILDGIDTVINLGAGLDTRPYRMDLPSNLLWIEVDHPEIITLKDKLLKLEVPRCQLKRLAIDLANGEKRKQFLLQIGSQSKKALVLTEGVVPYLSENEVTQLANDLHAQMGLTYWITEFFSPEIYRYLKGSLTSKKMKNAPLQFFPSNWMEFFAKTGWIPQEIHHSGEVAQKYGRSFPMPWWARILNIFASQASREKAGKMTGYILFKKV